VTTETLQHLVGNPVFVLVSSGVGALLGYWLKAAFDIWTSEAKRRQDLATHVIGQIEKQAPNFYLMCNYAYLFYSYLNRYVETKHRLQLQPSEAGFSPYTDLKSSAEQSGQNALFYAGKLYRVITDAFWVEGGRYFLPDRWANEAIQDLHNNLMSFLVFDPAILLRYILSKTEDVEFYAALAKAETDPALKDLRDQCTRFQDWLLKEERQVLQALAYARAYSDLFGQQMERLYKDWFEKGLLRKATADPRKAKEVLDPYPFLLDVTRECIKRTAEQRAAERQECSTFLLAEIGADPQAIDAQAFFNLAWNFYIDGHWDLAIMAYQRSLDKRPPDSKSRAATYNNLGNVYTSKASKTGDKEQFDKAAQMYRQAVEGDPENPIFHANLGLMCYKRKDYKQAIECYQRALPLEIEKPERAYHYNDLGNTFFHLERWDEAIEAYNCAIALNPFLPTLYANLADVYEKQGKYQLALSAARESVKLDPNSAEYYHRVGRLYGLLTPPQWDEAISACNEAVKREPGSVYVQGLIDVCKKSGQQNAIPPDLAKRMHEEAKPRSIDDFRNLGDIYVSLRDDDRALEEYEKWVRRREQNRQRKEGILLEYKMVAGQVYVYKIEVESATQFVGLFERQQQPPTRSSLRSEQTVRSVDQDGNYELEVAVRPSPEGGGDKATGPAAPVQNQTLSMVQSRTGAIVNSPQLGAQSPTMVFPDRKIRIGDTWEGTISLPVPSPVTGENVVTELDRVYRLSSFEMVNGRACAHISVSGSGRNVKLADGVELLSSAVGDTWFAFEEGFIEKSDVESRAVITSEEAVVLTTTKLVVEMLHDESNLGPGSGPTSSGPSPGA